MPEPNLVLRRNPHTILFKVTLAPLLVNTPPPSAPFHKCGVITRVVGRHVLIAFRGGLTPPVASSHQTADNCYCNCICIINNWRFSVNAYCKYRCNKSKVLRRGTNGGRDHKCGGECSR